MNELRRALVVSSGVAALVCAACAGTTSGAQADAGSSGTSASMSCSELAVAASQEVDGVLQAHRSCAQASDCVSVGFSAACFDSCSRAIRADGKPAFEAAQEKVNAAQCAQFAKQGCKVTIPPCAPPSAVACVAGACTS